MPKKDRIEELKADARRFRIKTDGQSLKLKTLQERVSKARKQELAATKKLQESLIRNEDVQKVSRIHLTKLTREELRALCKAMNIRIHNVNSGGDLADAIITQHQSLKKAKKTAAEIDNPMVDAHPSEAVFTS